ncbi:putative ubiquitin carboxyl-terminal hydrolase 3 [Psilocybe cubensis]|uniref:Ubiquitin carboxyl-terminal hydrolase 3 n=2 Tax=Psilocybe cubensis TaxID=181762 RepID=A0ACB8H9L0_PSICU|nr:putative ubiquitin carboxyl-terminal hydrolase 3 [Psilocybe cubensis]KAH9484498.1 putative ubiquitin carboxyl-terminal hydrolase 3 [Psilocybe cubensis]
MAYPQQGPGPSTYYQQSPPPQPQQSQPPQHSPQAQAQLQSPPPQHSPQGQHHHIYGTHSPGPRPIQNYYQYPPPGPPPHQYMGSYPPQGSPSRGRGGRDYGGRGGAHHYHHHQQQHHAQHQHPPPHHQPHYSPYSPHHVTLPHPQHPHALPPHHAQQHAQHVQSYSPQPQKYSSGPTFYPSPSAPVFTPSWQTQQAMMSPLPKQLSMPPPQPPALVAGYSNYYEPPQPLSSGVPSPVPVVQSVEQPAIPIPIPPVCEDLKTDPTLPTPEPSTLPTSVSGTETLPSLSLAVPSTSTATSSPALSPSAPSFFPSGSSPLSVSVSATPAPPVDVKLPESEPPLEVQHAAASTTPTPQEPQEQKIVAPATSTSSYARMGSIATEPTANTPTSTSVVFIAQAFSSSSPRTSPALTFSALPNGVSSTSPTYDTITIPIPASSSSISSFPSSSSISTSTLPTSQSSSTSASTTLPDVPLPPSLPHQPNPILQWAIWARRPYDPANAPGIIISPRARPPMEVVQAAMGGKGPGVGEGVGVGGPKVKDREGAVDGEEKDKAEKKPEEKVAVSADASFSTSTSTSTSSAASVADAETTVPCSPASSHTSVDASVVAAVVDDASKPTSGEKESAKAKDLKEKSESSTPKASSNTDGPTPAAPAGSATLDAKSSLSTSATTEKESASEQSKEGNTLIPAAATSTITPATMTKAATTETATPATTTPGTPAQSDALQLPSTPTTSTTAAVPAAATPPVKKSWASLLRPATSSPSTPGASGSGSPSGAETAKRSALPVSNVVGFSIPATALAGTVPNASPAPAVPVAGAAIGITGARRADLITLLTTGPPSPVPPPHSASTGGPINFAAAAASANAAQTYAKQIEAAMGATLKVRPRGLVNSGNMCFANSVLQVMVYCPPFHRLFGELGRVFRGLDGEKGNGKEKGRETPLVDATIEFLREFVEDKKVKGVNGNGNANGSANGNTLASAFAFASASGSGRGKGKEKDISMGEPERNEDDWDGESFLPTGIYDAMKAKKRFDGMRGGHQEDAEEFFGFYLDTLEEELLGLLHAINPPPQPTTATRQVNGVEEKEEAAPPEEDGWLEVGKRNRMVHTRTIKVTESPITRIFGGKFRSTLRAPGQKDSVVVEDWRSLRLDIQRDQIHTIQDALSYISYPQPVQVTQGSRTIEAQQQVLIEALPPILVLHIKRFCYDTAVGGVVKVGKQIAFGPELEIGADVMVPAAKKSQPVKYKLFGALYHHGLSASGGHYTLDVLHPNRYPTTSSNASAPGKQQLREGWVRIDDNLVSDVRPDDVFGSLEKDESKCAYLLFYRRI